MNASWTPKPRRGRRRIVWQIVSWTGTLLIVAAWFMFLRPPAIGGTTGFVFVRGTSMLPTYEPGDLVLLRKQTRYAVGDVLAFRVPAGEPGAGTIVIHRAMSGNGTQGFLMRGDNNNFDDGWRPRTEDVVGRAWKGVPLAGQVLAVARAPVPLAGIAASITIAIMLVPAKPKRSRIAPV